MIKMLTTFVKSLVLGTLFLVAFFYFIVGLGSIPIALSSGRVPWSYEYAVLSGIIVFLSVAFPAWFGYLFLSKEPGM